MDAPTLQPAETFARYLARWLIAREGLFPGAAMPEAQALEQAFDIVLTQDDGMLRLVCILDREADPERPLAIGAEDLQRIGEECLKHAGRAGLFIDVGGAGGGPAGLPRRAGRADAQGAGRAAPLRLIFVRTGCRRFRIDSRLRGNIARY